MKILFSLLTGALIAQSTHAATALVSYDFEDFANGVDPTGATGYPSLSRGAYVSSAQANDSSAYVNTIYEDQWDSKLMRAVIRRQVVQGIYIRTLEDAVAYDASLKITYTPTVSTSFSTITLDAGISQSSTVGVTLRSSLTGDLNLGPTVVVNQQVNLGEKQSVSFDLSAFDELQNVTETVEFFLYLDNQGANGIGPLFVDNLTLNGTAVPEPASAGLAALGVAGLLIRRRRGA